METLPYREGFQSVTGGRVWYAIVGANDATPLLTLHGGPGYPHDYLQPLADLAVNPESWTGLGPGNCGEATTMAAESR